MGTVRNQLADFQVVEIFDRNFSGTGEHLYLLVEKRGLNTQDVQKLLAKHYDVALLDVSYAGLKDKRAVTQQWFSIRLPKTAKRPKHNNFTILDEAQHDRKLRRGDHQGNSFRIKVRGVSKSVELSPDALQHPLPNYFGPQRFGNQHSNIHRSLDWIARSQPRVPRAVRSLHLSVLRSYIFNEVLANRVRKETWNTEISGDVLVDDVPTGPLWGRGRLPTSRKALSVERTVQRKHDATCQALEWVGLKQERRALVMHPTEVAIQRDDATIELRFALPKGSYATVALNEYFDVEGPRA